MPFLNYEKRHSVTSILTAIVQPFRLVNFAGAHAGPNDDVQGISEQGGRVGDAISLVTGYSYPVIAAGPIAAGSWVGPASDGTGRVVAGGSYGRALTAAAAAGDDVVVAVGSGSGAGLPPAVRGLVSADGIPGMPGRLPFVLSSPPTAVLSAAGAATSIAGSITIVPDEPGAFSYFGGPNASEGGSYRILNKPTTAGATAHGWVEFWLDTADSTGRIELLLRGSSATANVGMRVAVQQAGGDWGYVTAGVTFATGASDGLIYRGLLTLGAAGRYRLRVECSTSTHFAGVSIAATDSVQAVGRAPKRYLVLPDSYGNTVSDSGTSFQGGDNFVNFLRYLTGYDLVCISIGGSGYMVNGSGVKAADHLLADMAAAAPLDGVILAYGYNDYNTGGIATADVATQAAACLALIRAYNPLLDIVVVSPWAVKGLHQSSVTRALNVRNVIKAAAINAGAKFLDLLSLPVPLLNNAAWSDVTTSAITGGSSTTVTVGSAPEPFASGGTLAGRTGWYATIIDGDSTETRKVTSMGTTNPRTLTTAAWAFSHAAGCPIVISGPSWITGTGKQGATVGDGNADRYVGTDGTHPTVAGHRALAAVIHDLWTRSVRA